MDKWNNEIIKTQEPPNDIVCVTCKYKEKPVVIGGYTCDRSKYGRCDKYTSKPEDILWGKTPCPYYEREVNGQS